MGDSGGGEGSCEGVVDIDGVNNAVDGDDDVDDVGGCDVVE